MLFWGILFHILFLITYKSSYLRTIFNSAGLSLVILAAVVELIKYHKKYRLPVFLGLVYGTYSLSLALRIIPIWQLKENYSFSELNAFDLFYLFVVLSVTMIGSFGFILLLKEIDDSLIEESDNLRKTALGQSALGIAIADSDTKIRYVNKVFEEQSLIKAENIIGQPAQFIISQLTPQERTIDLIQTIRKNQVWQGEFIRNNPSQEPIYFELIVAPIFNNKNEVNSYICFTSDVSAKRYNEKLINDQNEQLKTINQNKNWLFSVLAHDLRSPIGNINSMLKLITQFMLSNNQEKAQKYLHLASDSAGKTYELLDNLLKWAINQQDIQSIQASEFKLSDVIESTIELYQNFLKQKKIELISSFKQDCTVYADSEMVQTAFRNILSNAIKFTPAHGKISIICKIDIQNAILQIKDTGVGMSKEQINCLFEFKEKKSTKGTQGEGGTGIGLVLAFEFIKQNNGEIKVESIPDKGSVFSIYLPRQKQN